MTRDELIELATQVYGECVWHESALLHLEAFAKLVAAKEQKKWQDQTVVEIHEAILEEREACAKVCDELVNEENNEDYRNAANWCSVRIRARGEA